MSTNTFLPAGRTSRIKKGEVYLQLQTEYAARPYPRITTTIINDGRVIHKVEKKLIHPVSSWEEQQRIENVMRGLHSEISAIVQDDQFNAQLGVDVVNATAPAPPGDDEPTVPNLKQTAQPKPTPTTVPDKLAAITGVRRVLELDNDGNFSNSEPSESFRGIYKELLKSLKELIAIFDALPGENGNRQKGVYEVERNRLYFISGGKSFYFVLCEPKDEAIDFEKEFKEIVTPPLRSPFSAP